LLELLVEIVSQVFDLSQIELADHDTLLRLAGAQQRREHQRQHGTLTERVWDNLRATPLFVE
jgi:hypothetical protein